MNYKLPVLFIKAPYSVTLQNTKVKKKTKKLVVEVYMTDISSTPSFRVMAFVITRNLRKIARKSVTQYYNS